MNSQPPMHPCPGLDPCATGAPAPKARAAGRDVLFALLMLVLGGASLGASHAQSTPQAAAPPPPPENITGADLVNSMRSDVRIIARKNHEVEEYRAGNNVYMIKVKPRNAPPYYLIDQDGSGNLQWSRGQQFEQVAVPHWAIVRW